MNKFKESLKKIQGERELSNSVVVILTAISLAFVLFVHVYLYPVLLIYGLYFLGFGISVTWNTWFGAILVLGVFRFLLITNKDKNED